MERSKGGVLLPTENKDAEETPSIRRRAFVSLCAACHETGGVKGRSPIRAFDKPFKGTVHQKCLTLHQGYIITVRSRKGSKTKILMGGLIDHLLKPVRVEELGNDKQ